MYKLNDNQKEWLLKKPDDDELRRFLIHGPADTDLAIDCGAVKMVGRLRGVQITRPVDSIALAFKEVAAIRHELIQTVDMIPLDEEGMGIADTPEQKVMA